MLACDYTNALIAIVMIMPFVYEFSHRFRLYLKFFLFYASVMLCSVLCIPFIIWRPGDVRNTLIATLPLQLLNPLLGLHWEVKGQEHITVDRAAIVVANHQSSVDFLGMVYMWPMFEKITAIAKKELFYAMPFGMTAWLCGTRFIDRGNPERAKMSMNKALEYVTEEKVKLWVFPEGTRSMADEMLPFKKGAFHLAIEGQLPVLPVVYSSYRGFLNHSLKIFNPGHIIVTCLPPISTIGMTKEDMPHLMEEVRAQMMEVYTKTSSQVHHPWPLTEAVKKNS
ncbi:1-acyl-sn-glycerol-3-phosphate acyltransferase alpha [Penaeus vannamei]|uniref:1-acyl-sn-glycerol-3-phosphate acyltransferase alpha n=1 Tax=Penaeus vannamei TaxID=6689 RepID=UPI000F6622DB|nr:1-acyl-sn-glycerol-3-phosphate acyltransferase alpha-like [Penaeus vannamei]XP_027238635.1 1-acyl-sn-glycerol-3-phosphate acyltransferase alpha-like [Penaeus vannamei]